VDVKATRIATWFRSASRERWNARALRWVVSIFMGLSLGVVVCAAGPLDAQWFPIGPAPEGAAGFNVTGGVSGRVWSIAFSQNFDQHGHAAMYIATAGGGVWRSTDFSQPLPTWAPLTDHLPNSVPFNSLVGFQNIGAVAVDPNHPWIVYASSGDPAGPGGNSYGGGMLKSTDGGGTWMFQTLGSSFAPASRVFSSTRRMLPGTRSSQLGLLALTRPCAACFAAQTAERRGIPSMETFRARSQLPILTTSSAAINSPC
jgi:hypothetical protein